MAEPTVDRIPGVFPFVDIERDGDGYPVKVVVTGVNDRLVIRPATTGMGDPPWLDVKFNTDDLTLET